VERFCSMALEATPIDHTTGSCLFFPASCWRLTLEYLRVMGTSIFLISPLKKIKQENFKYLQVNPMRGSQCMSPQKEKKEKNRKNRKKRKKIEVHFGK
jgi:hypothetical protein